MPLKLYKDDYSNLFIIIEDCHEVISRKCDTFAVTIIQNVIHYLQVIKNIPFINCCVLVEQTFPFKHENFDEFYVITFYNKFSIFCQEIRYVYALARITQTTNKNNVFIFRS